jgi:hypothetical protein
MPGKKPSKVRRKKVAQFPPPTIEKKKRRRSRSRSKTRTRSPKHSPSRSRSRSRSPSPQTTKRRRRSRSRSKSPEKKHQISHGLVVDSNLTKKLPKSVSNKIRNGMKVYPVHENIYGITDQNIKTVRILPNLR